MTSGEYAASLRRELVSCIVCMEANAISNRPREGAPVNGRQGVFGDHHVQLVVAVPGSLSGEEEELIRKLAELQDHKVSDKGFWRDILGRLTS